MRKPRPLLSSLLALTLVASVAEAAAAAEASAPDPRGVLAGMAKQLGGAKRFSVEVKSGYDAVQESGRKVEFMEQREILVDRPARMRVETKKSDGDENLVLVDGRTVTAQTLGRNVYAQTEAKPTLDETIVYFVKDLRMRMPLAMLLVSNLDQELSKRVTEAEFVETTSMLGEPAHHIVGSTDTVDFQIWVSTKTSLPLRIVLTYREEEGTPQFRANFEDWDLSPSVRNSHFEFDAPKGAQKIAFINQVRPPAAKAASASASAK